MKLVIDANILFAALIREGFTFKLIIQPYLELYAPEFLKKEFNKYEPLIIKKTNNKEQVSKFKEKLFSEIIFISKKEYCNFLEKAKNISPDINDIDYLALCLKLNCPLWRHDKLLKKQDEIKIFSTKEVSFIFSLLYDY